MKTKSTISDLIEKVNKFTTIQPGDQTPNQQSQQGQVLLWRVNCRGGRGPNKFVFVEQNTEEQKQTQLFRPKKDTEVFYLRFTTAEEQVKFGNPGKDSP